MGIEEVFPKSITALHIPDIVVQTWIIMAALTLLAYIAGKRLQLRPRGWQHLIEMGADFVDNLILQRSRRPVRGLFELLATMMLYIAVANLLGLIPELRAPTRSLNTTVALAIISFFSVQYFGVRERGVIKYARSFVQPLAFMLPLNILGQVSRTVAMSLRLFGNVIAGEIIAAVMFQLLPLFGPIPFNLLGALTGVIQALVFTFLTVTFITEAIGDKKAS
jgi:F-type H+-transporting ATPase subunit a